MPLSIRDLPMAAVWVPIIIMVIRCVRYIRRLMRDAIYKHPHRDAYLSTLRFWAALQETRQPCSPTRDELLDSWHTLLMAKFISAMMFPDAREQAQALSGLSHWLSSSLRYTPGNDRWYKGRRYDVPSWRFLSGIYYWSTCDCRRIYCIYQWHKF